MWKLFSIEFQNFYLQHGGKPILVTVKVENRSNSRVSITSKGINILISKWQSAEDARQTIQKFCDWALAHLEEKGTVESIIQYADYSTFQYCGIEFTMRLFPLKIEKVKVALDIKNKILKIEYPHHLSIEKVKHLAGKLVSRVLGTYFQDTIEKRARQLNDMYIHKKIETVSLKNTSSRWGSCSSKGNLNFSTRLLFAPLWVIDYVIVHELCHLIYLDHSDKFWNEVKKIIPNYKKAEKHLKTEGVKYNFS